MTDLAKLIREQIDAGVTYDEIVEEMSKTVTDYHKEKEIAAKNEERKKDMETIATLFNKYIPMPKDYTITGEEIDTAISNIADTFSSLISSFDLFLKELTKEENSDPIAALFNLQ